MNRTSIEWTDFSSNLIKYRDPEGRTVHGCVKVSPGCANCYASAISKRFSGGEFTASRQKTLTPYFDDAEAQRILRTRVTGKRVFVGDMTDVFGEWVPDALLDRMFAVFALRPDLTFQLLTKRPERMRAYLTGGETRGRVARAMDAMRVPVIEGEEERPIPGFPGYWVTNAGRVLSAKRGSERSVLRPDIGEQGHSRVTLQGPDGRSRFLVHRLVLEVWEGPPPTGDSQACHLNGNAQDNRISNLRWGSQAENWGDRTRHGNFRSYSKLSTEDVVEIRRRGAAGEPAYAIAKDYPVSDTQVRNILNGMQWVTTPGVEWPLANCWLGTSVENQAAADERIPALLDTPAAVRFLSCEPLLEPVDLEPWLRRVATSGPGWRMTGGSAMAIADIVLDWVIVGGESGPGARPCDLAWIRGIVGQCKAAGVPVFVKQGSGPRPGMPTGDPELDALKEFPR